MSIHYIIVMVSLYLVAIYSICRVLYTLYAAKHCIIRYGLTYFCHGVFVDGWRHAVLSLLACLSVFRRLIAEKKIRNTFSLLKLVSSVILSLLFFHSQPELLSPISLSVTF